MTNGDFHSDELLAIYHDLWDLRLRASRMDHSFLVYLLDLALEDVHEQLAKRDPTRPG